MHVIHKIAIGFLAALVVMLIGAVIFLPDMRSWVLTELTPFVVIFGAVTVTYQYPVAGTAAQTAALAATNGFHNGYNTVRATVIATADGDTDAIISHGMGISVAALALGQPEIGWYWPTPAAASARLSLWTFANTDGNNVTATKATTGGSGNAAVQLEVAIRRPHSIAI